MAEMSGIDDYRPPQASGRKNTHAGQQQLLVQPPNTINHDRIKAIPLAEMETQTSKLHQWECQMEDSLQLVRDIHHPNNLCRAHRLTIHAHSNQSHRCRQISITLQINKIRVPKMHIHLNKDQHNLIHVLTNSSNSMGTILMIALTMRLMMSMKAWSFPDRKEREK